MSTTQSLRARASRLAEHRWTAPVVAVVAVAVVLVAPNVVSLFEMRQWTSWLALVMLTISLTWVWGHGGIFSFGQVLFFGLGAYAYGLAGINILPYTGETTTAVVIGILIPVLIAAGLGYFLFYGEVSGVYVAIATLAATLVAFTLMASTADPIYTIGGAALGGYNGMTGIPSLTLPGVLRGGIDGLFVLAGVVAVAVAYLVHVLRRSGYGRVVRGIRENEERMRLVGFDTRRYKLTAFIIGAAIAGLGGCIYAAWGGFADPSLFGLQMATMVVAWALVGGRTSIIGAFIGVFGVQQLTSSITETGTNITPLVVGAILIFVVLLLPAGIVPTVVALWKQQVAPRLRRSDQLHPGGGAESAGLKSAVPPHGVLNREAGTIRVTDLHRAFGGVKALNGVDWNVDRSDVWVLLGPNGAGKSTLFNSIAGIHLPTSGSIRLNEVDVSKWRTDRRTRAGIAIKRQVPSLFGGLSAYENLWLAARGSGKSAKEADATATELGAWLGIERSDASEVNTLSHGQQQWLDIAMALAASPSVLLLDEPTAGMTREESSRIAELIKAVGTQIPVIVVEHDMEFVAQLDAPVTVLHRGEVLAHGALQEIKQDERVLEVYLGRTPGVEG